MKLTREEILAKLRTILVEITGCNPDDVVPEAWILSTYNMPEGCTAPSLGADSLDHVEIIMAVEEEFGIDITDDEAEKIKTVAQAIEHIERELA